MAENKLGNQAMQSLLRDRFIQAKLSVSQPQDPHEREADEVAARVMGTPVQLARKAADFPAPRFDGASAAQVENLGGAGKPLDESTRNFFEPRFGHDFSTVRIHSDQRAAESARSINALAYTRGRDIVFAQGQYQPDNVTGKTLLAHELAHVVQQGEGAGRGVAADTVQRACGPAIGTPAGCAPLTSEPVGEQVSFRVNCDEYTSPAERTKVLDFADSMLATDRVRVHGFASTDGDATFNANLSCARANRVAHTLTFAGHIAASQVDVFSHGPVSGPVDQRRSVVLERDPAGSRATTPQLSAVVLSGPTAGDCGEFTFEVFWSLSRASHPVNGGFIVQEVTVNRIDDDCAGNPIQWGHASPLHLFEAWQVIPGTMSMVAADGDTDTFWMRRPGTACATGSIRVDAVATYHDNVAALPPDMIRNNPDTTAGGIRSSLNDPALGGTASRPITHSISVTWDCCPCQSAPTVIISHTP